MRDWRDKKQPALYSPNVQAAFLCFSLVETQLSYRNFIEVTLSGSLHPQRIYNQLKHIRMPAAAGVIEVKRIVNDGVLGLKENRRNPFKNGCSSQTANQINVFLLEYRYNPFNKYGQAFGDKLTLWVN